MINICKTITRGAQCADFSQPLVGSSDALKVLEFSGVLQTEGLYSGDTTLLGTFWTSIMRTGKHFCYFSLRKGDARAGASASLRFRSET